MENYYSILDVSPSASPQEIKESYKFLAQANHPDKFSSDKHKKRAEEKFKRINAAYEILSDSAERAKYDSKLSAQSKQTGEDQRQRDKAKAEQQRREHERKERTEETQDEKEHQRQADDIDSGIRRIQQISRKAREDITRRRIEKVPVTSVNRRKKDLTSLLLLAFTIFCFSLAMVGIAVSQILERPSDSGINYPVFVSLIVLMAFSLFAIIKILLLSR